MFLGIFLNESIPLNKRDKVLKLIKYFADKKKASAGTVGHYWLFELPVKSNISWEGIHQENVLKI